MKNLCVAVAVLLLSGPANLLRADFVFTLTQVGPDVVVNGGGTLNLSALTLYDTTAGTSSSILPASGYIGVAGSVFTYVGGGFSGPTAFGDNVFTYASSASGDAVGIEANGFFLFVPAGYVSGTPLSNTMTFNNATFASLGFTPGTYIYTWGTGATADSLTITVDETVNTNIGGRGTIESQGNQVSFNFRASQASEGSKLGFFAFCDPGAGVCIEEAGIYNLSISGNTANFSGSGHLDDGTKVRLRVSVTDNGSPGSSDTISITLDNGYSVNGTLTSGNIRIY